MSEIRLDVPNIVVLVNNDPDYRKVIVKPDSNFNVNINVPRLVSQISGSFIQFAETALTASYALTANRLIDSGTLQLGYITASSALISQSLYVGGLMYGTASQALTASYALNAAGSGFPYSGSAVITGSLLVSGSGITGSLLGTASIAENITVIFAGTYETGSDNPIVPTPSGGLIYVTSASYATTSSLATSVQYVNVLNKPTLVSSSTQVDYNQIQNKPSNISSASFASSSISASYALTASVALNLPANIITSSRQINTGSFTGSFVGTFTGPLTGTSSWAQSSSNALVANSISFTTFSNTSYYFPQNVRVEGILTAQEFYTEFVSASIIYESGSTKFGNSADDTHQFTGSLLVNGGITGSLLGSSSFATTASYALTAGSGGGGGSGAGFPFSGSAVITGSLLVSGSPGPELTIIGDPGILVTGSILTDGDTLTLTGSLLTTADTLLFTGSFNTTGSFSMISDADTFTLSGSLLTTADTLIFSGSSYFSGSTFIYGESYIDGGTY